jgi:peroxiredoxin
MFCRERVAQLRDHEGEIRAAGIGLAAIGTGDLRYAEHFKAERKIDFPLLVDDDLLTYRLIGARRGGLKQILAPPTLAAGLRTVAHGRFQGRSGPHPMQFGATHLIHPDGSVPYAWINDNFAADPPFPEVLTAVRAEAG